jgi:ATP-dependent DNA helicase RecG
MNSLPEQLSLNFPKETLPLLTVNEIYEKADQPLLEALKEDRRLERKSAGVQSRSLGDYFSMFANTKPDGGVLVIGRENDGQMSGCSNASQNHLNDLERTADNHCSDARFETKRIGVQRQDGVKDFVTVFRIFYRHDKLVRTHSGDAFVRVGESKKKLSDEEAREIEIDKGQIDLEGEPCRLDYPQAFDMELIRDFTASYKAKRGIDQPRTSEDVLMLNHLGVIKSGQFVPNNACALLFAKDPRDRFPGCKIRFLRFDGEQERTGEKWNAVKDIWVDQASIPRQIVEIEKIMDAQIREFSRLGSDGLFYTAPEYPKAAWYEAVVNASVHRSYGLKNMNMFVKMFDDRLVIESPGGFPPLVTPENIYDASATESALDGRAVLFGFREMR